MATLDVGANYIPGSAISIADGVSVSFTFGTLSATNNDAFVEHVVSDSDTADILVALGLNSLFNGTDAESCLI